MLGYTDLKGLSGTVLSSSTRVNVLSWFLSEGDSRLQDIIPLSGSQGKNN